MRSGRSLLAVVVALVATAACDRLAPRRAVAHRTPTADARHFTTPGDFARGYWLRPIPAQGARDSIVHSLSPASCGRCHQRQLTDWSTTLHAGAFSPGLAGQLVEWEGDDDETVRSCQACHAPLTEQLPAHESAGTGSAIANASFDATLRQQGITCAACHMRGGVVHGPPMRNGALTSASPRAPHGGSRRSTYFEDVDFCGSCHQFDEPSANGKSLQNTVAEWRRSRYASAGTTCQQCHMPDRRHLWRGIHDSATVRHGVTITLAWARDGAAELRLANSGVGHALPTYVTPAIDLELTPLDAHGQVIPGAARVHRIARTVHATTEGWVEDADTRLLPDSSAVLRADLVPGTRQVLGRVRVMPDAFYAGLYGTLLLEQRSGRSRAMLEQARARAAATPYDLFLDTLRVDDHRFGLPR